jgi:hypothetical protein
MKSSNLRMWEGEEWEQHIQLLLKRHYRPGDYQEIPAKHCGDFGIEGYSTDGCAYQCYATQEPCTTLQRYESQRNKITTDIGKFIDNKPELIKIFGKTLIRRWILMVPVAESAQLVQHASKKTQQVLDVSLPYVSSDFKVIISTDSCFAKEINELANAGVLDVDMQSLEIEEKTRIQWLGSNDSLVVNLNSKAEKIPGLCTDEKKDKFKYSIIDHYLRGQNLMEEFNRNFPDIYAKIDVCKQSYEYHLQTMSLMDNSEGHKYFSQAVKDYNCELRKSIPTLPPAVIQVLSWEAISDWLMRCPLDF